MRGPATLLECALELARRGFRIFPLIPGYKEPAIDKWQEKATTDPDIIKGWWRNARYNIGIACGNGLLVIDIDDKNGKIGSQSFTELGVQLEDYDTFTVSTPSGGAHLYYLSADHRNKVGGLGRGLDVRSAGGYVVGPGSVLVKDIAKAQVAGTYIVRSDTTIRELPECISQRLGTLDSGVSPTALVATPVDLDDPTNIVRATEYLINDAPIAEELNGGDETTFLVAATLKDMGISETTAHSLMVRLWLDRCKFGWPYSEAVQWVLTKVTNAFEYGTLNPGIHTPQAQFAGVKFPESTAITAQDDWFNAGDSWEGSVTWLYKGLLPTTGVCLLTAPSGAGKTFVALELARTLAMGAPFFGVKPRFMGSTLYLAAEAFGSLKIRLSGLLVHYGKDTLPISATHANRLKDKRAWQALAAKIVEKVNSSELPVRLIILDTLSASGLLEDEKDNSDAASVLVQLGDMSQLLNALVVVVHHPPKTGHGERGASAIRDNADYVMEISREGKSPIRTLSLNKSRDGEEKTLGIFSLVPVQVGFDEDMEPVTTMVLSTGASRDPLTEEITKAINTEFFMRCVNKVAARGVSAIDIYDNAILYTDVKLMFEIESPGSKDRSNLSKKWLRCVNQAEEKNEIKLITHNHRKYFILKGSDYG